MQFANQEALSFNHAYIGTEHILLGLVREGNGVAANVLKNFNVNLGAIRLETEKLIEPGPDVTVGKLPHTPKTRSVIEFAIQEANNLNHNYVGTEHLLLGLLRVTEGTAYKVLVNMGLKLEDIRLEIMEVLGITNLDATPDVVSIINMQTLPTLKDKIKDIFKLDLNPLEMLLKIEKLVKKD
jgi:ATP-dependent Clp protease ATP-binding subunit ClpC